MDDKLITFDNLDTFLNAVVNDEDIAIKSTWSSEKINDNIIDLSTAINNAVKQVPTRKVDTIWKGTQSEYDALTTKNETTLYIII